MEIIAIIMMIFILVLIWGGFIFTLGLAYKKEGLKKINDH